MPGVVGFTLSGRALPDADATLTRMASKLNGTGAITEVYSDHRVACGRRSRHASGSRDSYVERGGVRAWLHGEILGFSAEAAPRGGAQGCATLVEKYLDSGNLDVLEHANGNFVVVVYDSDRSLVHLASDRYGIGRLYWTDQGGRLAWSSELKAFLALPWFRPQMNPLAVEQFLKVGYCLDSVTWFEGVNLSRAGTTLTWPLESGVPRARTYWSWESIRPPSGQISLREAAAETGRLFRLAVQRRAGEHERVGVLLSGGRDSRAVLASVPESSKRPPAVTFGKRGAYEIDVAHEAASARSADHHVRHIDVNNWLDRRLEGVWWTDGEVSLLHMHVCAVTDLLPSLCDVELNGFAGDLILGGSYLLSPKFLTRTCSRLELVARVMRCDVASLRAWSTQGFSKSDYYFLNNRVRRFTRSGLVLEEVTVDVRTPFLDNDLIDFVYSLPDILRFRGQLYNEMLLESFPSFFQSIPIAKSGEPIRRLRNSSLAPEFFRYYGHAVGERLLRAAGRFKESPSFADYPAWIRSDPALSLVSNLVCSSKALHREFARSMDASALLAKHLAGENQAVMICRLLTLELWLRQVLTGEFRPT